MKKYKQLSFEDLVKIETLMEEDFKPTEIAIQLSKDKSCIYRCIKNNSVEGEFKADVAYELIRQRKLSSVKPRRLLPDSVLAKGKLNTQLTNFSTTILFHKILNRA